MKHNKPILLIFFISLIVITLICIFVNILSIKLITILLISLIILINYRIYKNYLFTKNKFKFDNISNLKFRLNNYLDKITDKNIDINLLEDAYLKSIKIFESLVTDNETGTLLEEHFKLLLDLEINRSTRYKKVFSLLLVKIQNDNIIQININYIFKKIVQLSRNFLREIDVIGKYKEKMLVLLLPETSIKGAIIVANRILELSQQLKNNDEKLFEINLAIGLSSFPYNGKNLNILLEVAEKNIVNSDSANGNQIFFNVK